MVVRGGFCARFKVNRLHRCLCCGLWGGRAFDRMGYRNRPNRARCPQFGCDGSFNSFVFYYAGQSQVRTYVLALVSVAASMLFIAAIVKMWSPDFAFAITLYGQMSIPTLILLMVATAGLAAFSLTATAR